MFKKRLSRRDVIKALGATSAATFLPWLRPQPSSAAGIPTRLLLYWSGSGVPRHVYDLKSAAGGAATETDFVFPDVRAPLNAIKNELITFTNLDMLSANVDPTSPANAHYAGETHCLAAANRASGDTAGGPSIDQYIAKAINSPNPQTRIPSLSLAIQTDGNVTGNKVCTSGPGEVISLEPSPAAVYQRLFSGFTAPSPMMMTGPSAAEIAALQRKSVLDFVAADFAALAPKLSNAASKKLDAHASAVRDLEKRLALGGAGTDGVSAECGDPGMSAVDGTDNAYPGDTALLQRNFDATTRLVQMGFACDLTRVALVSVAEPFGDAWDYTSGAWDTMDAHDLIHKTAYSGSLKDHPDAMAAVTRLHQLECRQFISMLDLLKQVPEMDGSSLLDHTIVLWCSQIAEHNHELGSLPWIIAGGSAAGFAPGRNLSYARKSGTGDGAPHNNLFVSVAQAMGVDTDTFGNPDVCTGPLDRLRS